MSLILNSSTMQDLWWSLIAQFLAIPTTTTADVDQGQSYTQLSVNAMPISLCEGEWVQLGNPADYITQQVQLASACNVGDTTLNVVAFTANYTFASGSTLLPLSSNQVSVSWPADGTPAWQITQDICFLQLVLEDGTLTQTFDEIWGTVSGTNITVSQSYLRGWKLGLVFYGPNAEDNASALRAWLVTSTVKDWLQNTAISLGGGGLSIIHQIRQPLRGPELYAGQWWNRVTLYIQAYELVQMDNQVPVAQEQGTFEIEISN